MKIPILDLAPKLGPIGRSTLFWVFGSFFEFVLQAARPLGVLKQQKNCFMPNGNACSHGGGGVRAVVKKYWPGKKKGGAICSWALNK